MIVELSVYAMYSILLFCCIFSRISGSLHINTVFLCVVSCFCFFVFVHYFCLCIAVFRVGLHYSVNVLCMNKGK